MLPVRWMAVTAVLMFMISNTQADVPATAPLEADFDLIPTVNMVPMQYRHRLVQQLSLAEDNQQTWLAAINHAKPEHREAVAFLLVNMPEKDLLKLKGDYLLGNVELAYKAREQTAWSREVPQEIFFRDVLPYANVDETRENWRKDYYDRFMPLVKDAKSTSEAVAILNKHVFPIVKVKYHATKREKPNQSPFESSKIGYASCTGLSIILSDACRAVGAPARLAGIPLWSDGSGNHTWTEVWDHQWYFVGSAEPGPLNQTWFTESASKADESKPKHRIYAATFEQSSTVFPLVWDENQTDVHAVDVTGYYTYRQKLHVNVPAGSHLEMRQDGILIAASPAGSFAFELPVGEYSVAILNADGKAVRDEKLKLEKSAPVNRDYTDSAK
jgi:hypothetical protein